MAGCRVDDFCATARSSCLQTGDGKRKLVIYQTNPSWIYPPPHTIVFRTCEREGGSESCIRAMRALIPTLTRRAVPKLHSKLLPTLQPRLSVATLVTEKPRLPFEGVRIVEKAGLLSGRLTGLLFADQGAEVLVLDPSEGADVDSYLNRGKIAISESDVALDSADIIIVDGEDDSIARLPHQIMMRTVAALPGDARFGHLPHDIDEDYLSAITGFFTDMDMMGWLDRPVTYTPLKLCSIYAGLIGANACAAALVDRLRCGQGREIHASRIAGGLSAIGALCLKQTGLPAHFEPPSTTKPKPKPNPNPNPDPNAKPTLTLNPNPNPNPGRVLPHGLPRLLHGCRVRQRAPRCSRPNPNP